MLRVLLILLFEALGFKSKKKADLRKKQESPFVTKLLIILGVIVLGILFIEFVFLCQGTESGLMRNAMNKI